MWVRQKKMPMPNWIEVFFIMWVGGIIIIIIINNTRKC